jgi:integrase
VSVGGTGSCPSCHSWGALYAGVCRGCYDFARRHEPGPCGSCRRDRPLKEGYCRNCWLQAALQGAGTARRAPDLGPADFAAVRWHQLSFAGMARLNRRPRLPRPEDPFPAGPPDPRWEQLELTAPGQSRLFHSRHWTAASVSSPALDRARAIASRLGETRGWNPRIQEQTRRALAVMLASRLPGEKIPWSSLEPALRPRDLSVSRAAEILSIAGLLDDDRVLSLDTWTESKLATLAPGIAACARSWVSALQNGTPRSLPRKTGTVRIYLRSVHPLLEHWSRRYDHLREVTAGDAAAAIAALRGHQRRKALTALRSLTRHCKKNSLIFTDPAARIRSTPRPETMILPLPAARISTATEAAITPAARLALALAAVHALRPDAIRHLALGDIDLANRRITIAGQSRPLDDLTRTLITRWLDWRRERWPRTSSPYLLINNQTAMTTRPVSENWLTSAFRGLGVTLEQLRVDRQLDEALTAGPDPLHLASVFGIGDETAIKYAAAARHLLASAAEEQPTALTANPGTTTGNPALAPPGSR